MTLPNTNTTPTAAQVGYGAQFSLGSGTPGSYTYTQIAEVTSIKPSGISVGTEEVTNLGSPGGWIEKIGLLLDGGSVEITGNCLNETTQISLETAAKTRVAVPIEFAFQVQGGSKTTTVTGLAIITKFNSTASIEPKKALTFSCSMEFTGAVTKATA